MFFLLEKRFVNVTLLKAGLPDLPRYNIPKRGKNIPNDHKTYLSAINGPYKYKMTLKWTNIFHSKAFQNIPKVFFDTIWQPWRSIPKYYKIIFIGIKINHLATLAGKF
jgi:hypothetical protein